MSQEDIKNFLYNNINKKFSSKELLALVYNNNISINAVVESLRKLRKWNLVNNEKILNKKRYYYLNWFKK